MNMWTRGQAGKIDEGEWECAWSGPGNLWDDKGLMLQIQGVAELIIPNPQPHETPNCFQRWPIYQCQHGIRHTASETCPVMEPHASERESVTGQCKITLITNGDPLEWNRTCPPRGQPGTSDASNLWMLKQDKVTSGRGLSNLVSPSAICKDNEKAGVVTTGRMTLGWKLKTLFSTSVPVSHYLHQ